MKRLHFFILVIIGLIPWHSGCTINTEGAGKTRPFPNSSFIETDKMMLHYRTWPAAVPNDTLPWVLLVHGMGGSTFSWENNAPVLASEGFNVVAVDVPPYGYSDKNPNYNQSVDSRSDLLWAFLDRIRPGTEWNLIGHSMGGGIVQCMAIDHPDRVGQVVFVDPALFNTMDDENEYRMRILRFRPFEWIATGLGNAFLIRPKKIRKLLQSSFGSEPDSTEISEYYRAISQPGTARALIRSSAKSKPVHPVDGKSFSKPAIAICGEKDTWVPLKEMQSLLDQVPSIKVVVIEGAGHCPMETHAGVFNQQVIRFLKSNDKQAPAI